MIETVLEFESTPKCASTRLRINWRVFARAFADGLLLLITTAVSISASPSAAQGIASPNSQELAKEIHQRFISSPKSRDDVAAAIEEVAAAIASAYGPAAIPALDEITRLQAGSRAVEIVPKVVLIATSLMSDEQRAFDVMEREMNIESWHTSLYLTYMPPDRRNALAWKLFERNVDMRDEKTQARANNAAFMLLELASKHDIDALVNRIRRSSDNDLKLLVDRHLVDRARLERLLDASDTDLGTWKAVQLRSWIRTRDYREGARGILSAKGLPTPYCVARAKFWLPASSRIRGNDYLSFCGEGAFWQVLNDPDGVTEIVTDVKRPEELRRAAVRVFVEAPKLIDNINAPLLRDQPALSILNHALEALEALVVTGDATVRTWIAQEILAQNQVRDQYRPIMRMLSIDKRFPPALQKQCDEYARQ